MRSPVRHTALLVLTCFGIVACDSVLSRWDRVTIEVDPANAPVAAIVADPGSGAPAGPTPAESKAPDVHAGADVVTGTAISRAGTVTDSLPVTIKWAKVSGPGELNFSAATALTTTISATVTGTYVVALTAKNSANNSATSTFKLLWDQDAPTPPTTLKTAAGSASGADTRFANSKTVVFAWSGAADGRGSGIRDYTIFWYKNGTCSAVVPAAVHRVTAVTATDYSVVGSEGNVFSFRVVPVDKVGLSGVTSGCSRSVTIDTTAPVDHMGLAADPGLTVDSVDVTVTFGATADYDTVEIRRAAAAAPDCSHGNVVATFTAPAFPTPTVVHDVTGEAGKRFGYTACIHDVAGNVTQAAAQPTAVSKPHILFITSDDTLTGDLGGVAGADTFCNTAAGIGGVGTQDIMNEAHWKALLSDSRLAARFHVAVTGQVKAVDMVHDLAASHDDFWNNGIKNNVLILGVNFDETGNLPGAAASDAWTGIAADGSTLSSGYGDPGKMCNDWTAGGVNGTVGSTFASGKGAFTAGQQACGNQNAIFCLSQPAEILFASFGAVPGATAGSVDLTIAPPAGDRRITAIALSVATSPTTPDASCNRGAGNVHVFRPSSTATIHYTDASRTGGTSYFYRICGYDQFGNQLTSALLGAAVVAQP